MVDKNNVDPIMIAEQNRQPNIVTILRVAKMNNELKEQDMSYSGDPMFDQILKDLLSLTSNEETDEQIFNDNEVMNDLKGDVNSSESNDVTELQFSDINLYSLNK